MERLCYSINSQQISANNKLLKAQKSFIRFHELYSNNVFTTTGKVADTGNKAWHIVLVDSDKIDQFLEKIKSGFSNMVNYGRLIISGYKDVPKEIKDVSIEELLSDDFFMMTLHPESNDQILYVLLSDSAKKQEVLEARSIEEIEDLGTILYVANFLEPPESVSFNILKRLYLIKGERDNLESTHIENNRGSFDVNCIDETGSTLLHQASYWGNKAIVRNVIRSGADIHKKDEICERLPVHIAALQGDIGVLEFYLKNGINVNVSDGSGFSLLHSAVWNNKLQAIQFLIQNGSKIDVKDKCLGKTALHVGADQGHTEAVEVLLDKGAFIDEVDDSGRTALYYSLMADCLETAKFLVKRGASIHIANKYGNKPLHIAAGSGYKDAVEFLLSMGSHINNQNNSGFSPLHRAAFSGCLHIVQLLVDQGADVTSVSKSGLTPFDSGKNHMDVASFLVLKMITIFQTQGNLEDAFKVCIKFLSIHGDELDSDQSEILDCIFKLAVLLYEQGQYSKALDILKEINAEIFISDDPVLRSKCELKLSIDEFESKYEELVKGLSGVFEKLENDLGAYPNDPLTAAGKLARDHFNKGEYDKTFSVLKAKTQCYEVNLQV